jgi:putative transposase
MSHTYSSIFFHLVWSTKNRIGAINSSVKKRLYEYIGGIIKRENGILIERGGMPDHVHLLVQISPQDSISNLMRSIKANSSRFMRENYPELKFSWQEGYGVFSVSVSMLPAVKSYIQRQEEHHKKNSFQEEFVGLLRKHDIFFNKEYLFS